VNSQRTLPGHPEESQSASLDLRGQLEQLQREKRRAQSGAGLAGRWCAWRPCCGFRGLPSRRKRRPAPAAADDSPISLAPLAAFTTKARGAGGTPGPQAHGRAGRNTLRHIEKYGVKIEDIAVANHEVLPSIISPLRVGTELKIP